jgi:hypothetical protein
MLRALATKELRETLWIVALALVFHLNFVSGAMGVHLLPWSTSRSDSIPFVDDGLTFGFSLVAALLAVGLGFRQSVGESAFGTDQFLLHRPLSRSWMIGIKLVIGAAMLLLSSAVPILVYGWWAATPGKHASPFDWSMTFPFWRTSVVITIVYFGSFLCGMRPGRWVGSRLWPLAAAGALAMLIGLVPWVSDWLFATVAAVDLLLVALVLFVAHTRDF